MYCRRHSPKRLGLWSFATSCSGDKDEEGRAGQQAGKQFPVPVFICKLQSSDQVLAQIRHIHYLIWSADSFSWLICSREFPVAFSSPLSIMQYHTADCSSFFFLSFSSLLCWLLYWPWTKGVPSSFARQGDKACTLSLSKKKACTLFLVTLFFFWELFLSFWQKACAYLCMVFCAWRTCYRRSQDNNGRERERERAHSDWCCVLVSTWARTCPWCSPHHSSL